MNITKDWDFVELRKLCLGKGLPDTTHYQNSLKWRWQRAHFYSEQAKTTWSTLFQKPFTLGDQSFNKAAFVYEAHVESCAYSIHSASDILAQIINLVILTSPFEESGVTLASVCTMMKKNGLAPSAVEKLETFRCSREFMYIAAFVNTIKHRKLVETNIRAEGGEQTRNELGMVFVPFEYKGVQYSETWGSDIVGKYRNIIHDRIIDVGLSVNEYLKK